MAPPKSPTPQAISALLKRAGFERSVPTPGRRGSGYASARKWSNGYSVTGYASGPPVRVWYFGGTREQTVALLNRCAIFIRARGWHAELSDDESFAAHLVVEASPEGSHQS